MRIFVATYALPKPDTSSGDLRFYEILKLLVRSHTVHLWISEEEEQLDDSSRDRYRSMLEQLDIKVYLWPTALKSVLEQHRYEVGLFEFYWIAERYLPLFRRQQPFAAAIIDSVDVAFAREEIAASLSLLDHQTARRTKQRELQTYRAADAVIAVSDADRELLDGSLGALRIAVVRNIIQPNLTRRDPGTKECVFVGSFRWMPNVDGITWFVQEVWPLVLSGEPEAVLSIIGSNPTEEISSLGKLQGVVVHGYVPDTSPHLQRAAISVAPLRYGGGMKGKVNEAMGAGLPVVTTGVGAQGLQAEHGKHLLVEDCPQSMAKVIIALLRDPVLREGVGRAGQIHTAELCSPTVAGAELESLLQEVTTGDPWYVCVYKWLTYVVAADIKSLLRQVLPIWLKQYIRVRRCK